jgi:hypothetical protein
MKYGLVLRLRSLVPAFQWVIIIYPEDEDEIFLRNAGIHLPDCTVS